MPQLIALLGAVAALFWAFNSLEKSGALTSLNPFLLIRRLKWGKEFGTKPLYRLRDPVEVAAVLLLGTAKCKGEVTSSQKAELKHIFTDVLKQSADDADDLLVAATHMLRDEVYIVDNLAKILLHTRRHMSAEQKASLLNLMEAVSGVEGPANAEQRKLIDKTTEILNQRD